MKVGIDLVELKRIKKLLKKNNLQKIFSQTELENIQKSAHPIERAGGYFAVKEAVLKAFGLGLFNGLELNQICVEYLENGKPFIKQTPQIKTVMQNANVTQIEISISHTEKSAIAICIVET